MSAPAARLRVLFLCWGYSIHARRRVQIFIDDPRFDVTVVSTHDYAFAGARNVLLGAARPAPGAAMGTVTAARSWMASVIPAPVRVLLRKAVNLLGVLFELRTMKRDLATLREAVRAADPHVVFLQTLQYPSFLAYRLPRELPMIVTFWNGDLTYFEKWTGLEMLAKKRLVVHGLGRVNAITVNSQTAFDAAVGLGADAAKMTLVRYPGADLARFFPRSRDEARKKLGIAARRVVLCPRGLGLFFNSDVIVAAAAEVVARHPDTLFLFISGVGGAEEWSRHLKLAGGLGIAGALRWDGQIPWEDMPWYYSASDVMVSVKTADSCPNCMLEAMACGIPVVMSDTSQNREWIQDGASGFLCPPRDPAIIAGRINRVLDDDGAMTGRFAQACLDKVRRDANSAINVEVIKSLVVDLAGRRVPGPGRS
jgi:glycosyltransferase involved in cell wall biosynthesis